MEYEFDDPNWKENLDKEWKDELAKKAKEREEMYKRLSEPIEENNDEEE